MDGRPLTNDEFWLELIDKSSGRESEFKARNDLQLALSCIAGVREIELTLMPMNLLILPTGELNELMIMPESISYDGFERPIPLAHEKLQQLIESYLKWLLANNINTQAGNSYLGFDPNAPLFLDDHYQPYTVQKRGDDKLSPNKMNKHLDELIKKTALWNKGIRRKSFIRTCTIFSRKMSTAEIMVITGQGEETVTKTLNCPVQTISVRLKTLREKGYLTRKEVSSTSGGIQFEYQSIYTLN